MYSGLSSRGRSHTARPLCISGGSAGRLFIWGGGGRPAHVLMKHWAFSAVLPVPPGINHSYGASSSGGRPVFYTRPAAKQWAKTARVELLRQGWRALPQGRYTWHIRYDLRCPWLRDLDGVCKALIDTCAAALDISDRDLTDLSAHKDRTPKRSEHIVVTVEVFEVES